MNERISEKEQENSYWEKFKFHLCVIGIMMMVYIIIERNKITAFLKETTVRFDDEVVDINYCELSEFNRK